MDYWSTFVGQMKHAEIFYLRWTSGTAAAFYIANHHKEGQEKKDIGNVIDVFNTATTSFYKSCK